MLHSRAGTIKAPLGSTRGVSISKVRHKSRCVRWKTCRTFYDLWRVWIFAVKSSWRKLWPWRTRRTLTRTQAGAALPRRWWASVLGWPSSAPVWQMSSSTFCAWPVMGIRHQRCSSGSCPSIAGHSVHPEHRSYTHACWSWAIEPNDRGTDKAGF